MSNTITSLTFLHEYCDFSDPNWVWILKGIARNKDNSGVTRVFFRRMILTKPSDIEECYNEIHTLANDPDTVYRIYVSLNSRDATKGLFQFQKKMIDVGMGLAQGLDDYLQMSKKIGSFWKTELEQRSCRGTKRFLLDLDNTNTGDAITILHYMQNNGMTIRIYRDTVSGVAIVFDACDTRELMKFCKEKGFEADLQRDSMVFVEQFKGKSQA